MKRCPTRGCMSVLYKDEVTNCPYCGTPLVDLNGKKRLRLRSAVSLTPAPAVEPFMQRTLFWFRCEGIVTDVSSKDFYTQPEEQRPFSLSRQQDSYPQCEMVLRVESMDGSQARNLYLHGNYSGVLVGDHIIADGTYHMFTNRHEVTELYDVTVHSRIRPSRPGGLFGR